MPVVKGGVWTNIEDEILKASVSKYGLNQWARVSSLLARKTPKQCKARWAEWLDPGIRKVEWSKDEDEKLLHLAKLMPTQWRTIAPIVGRTATQCLERYQRLLDEADAREGDDLGLAGPDGGETMAPSADDVRRLRPGELDPDPESKPARPDTIDMDEDEKEMLSEARARLANTQGKKAKRKARERQLEESRRLANLQKRRELKSAGINVRITSKKKGQMDYNADVPFEHAPASGFYDTLEEKADNENEREAFDPRRQQVQNKRKVDQQDGQGEDRKRRKNDKGNDQFAAAKKAGQMQKIREAEQSSKRRGLVLPAPQVSESELEDIVKMGMSSERANMQGELDGGATQGLVGRYDQLVAGTPIRTPRAPQEEDRIANEIRNARLRTSTQSALLGGENAEIDESGTTGYSGAAPTRQALATPNPMATPMHTQLGPGATPARGPDATPMRTPRDSLRLNAEGSMQLIGQTPADVRRHEQAMRNDVKSQLASLPKPKRIDWDLDLLEEQDESTTAQNEQAKQEDAAVRDRREKERRDAVARADLLLQSRVVQRGLPRPSVVDLDAMLKRASEQTDPVKRCIEREMALLMAHDARTFGNARVVSADVGRNASLASQRFDRQAIDKARMEVALELGSAGGGSGGRGERSDAHFTEAWESMHMRGALPGLDGYEEDEVNTHQLLTETFDNLRESLTITATRGNTLEAKLTKHHGGYMQRGNMLQAKIAQASAALSEVELQTAVALVARVSEVGGMRDRLEKLRLEVGAVTRLDREAQEVYRSRRAELDDLNRC